MRSDQRQKCQLELHKSLPTRWPHCNSVKKVLEPHCGVQGHRSQGLAQEHNCWTRTQVYQISNMLVFLMLPLLSLGKFREIHIQDPPSTGFLSSAWAQPPKELRFQANSIISLILRCILIQFYVSDMKIIKITSEILGNLGVLGTAYKCLYSATNWFCAFVPLFFYMPVPQGVGLNFGTGSAAWQLCGSVVLSGVQFPHL